MSEEIRADELFHSEIVSFALQSVELETPVAVLDRLHGITSAHRQINVLGAFRLPVSWHDLSDVEAGRNVFIHSSIPAEWWEEYIRSTQDRPSCGYARAQLESRPFTLTETMQAKEPIGGDRWSIDLAYRCGMRDNLVCPLGGRWVFVFWSADVMTNRLTPSLRAALLTGATLATARVQKLSEHVTESSRSSAGGVVLTAREEAVLRSLSIGNRTADVSRDLGISVETVRSHLKKAQAKLAARTLPHAVALGMRQRLFP